MKPWMKDGEQGWAEGLGQQMLGEGKRALQNANGSGCDRSSRDKAHRWHDSMETRWHQEGISALLPSGLLWLQLLRARTDSCEGPDSDLGNPAGVGNGKQRVLCIPARELNGYGIPSFLISGHERDKTRLFVPPSALPAKWRRLEEENTARGMAYLPLIAKGKWGAKYHASVFSCVHGCCRYMLPLWRMEGETPVQVSVFTLFPVSDSCTRRESQLPCLSFGRVFG